MAHENEYEQTEGTPSLDAAQEAGLTRTIQSKIESWRSKQLLNSSKSLKCDAATSSNAITITVRMRPMNENEKASLCQQIDGQASSYEMPEFENISIVQLER